MAGYDIVRTPDFQYSGFYFPEIVARLRRYNRIWAPEITNEDPREPFIQLERSFALMSHYNNVLLDMLANEVFLQTARLPESVRLHLAQIGYRMLPASPAQIEILGELNRTYSAPVQLFDVNRRFSTRRTVDDPEIVFENLEEVELQSRTDQLTNAYTMREIKSGGCWVSSYEPDIIYWTSGDDWVTADLNKTIELSGSTIGNDFEDLRITELLDETSPGSGIWRAARIDGAAFVTEAALSWKMREPSTNGASALNTGAGFVLFPTAPVVGDKFYFGFADVMWDEFSVVLNTVALGVTGRWEFYDPDESSEPPDLVTVDPPGYAGEIQFNLTSMFGTTEATGAHVQVIHVPSGYVARGIVAYSGGINFVRIPHYLGQSSPSVTEGDYAVSAAWRPIDLEADNTVVGGVTWGKNGQITFTLPQTLSSNWQKYSIYDIALGQAREGYYLRYRVTAVLGGAVGPYPQSLVAHEGNQYLVTTLTQGETVNDMPLGSSSGEAGQEFILSRTPFLWRSQRVYVDEGGGPLLWTEIDSFLTALSTDRVYVVDMRSDGTATIKFGDGVNGRIPPIGTNNIMAYYRVGGEEDGNVGADTVTVNRDGVGVFRSITNPRGGRYWVEADWNSIQSLERVKQTGPASLRTMYRAVTASDCEVMSRLFLSPAGIRPVARSRAYEEALGPKTIELVVVGYGGAALDSASRAQLAEFFNGGETYRGVLVLNHELTVTNYTPKKIGVDVEIESDYLTVTMVKQLLTYLISPMAVETDGTTYVWRFGQEVPLSRLSAAIFALAPGRVYKVRFNSPSSDILLSPRELPIYDPVSTNVTIVAPDFS